MPPTQMQHNSFETQPPVAENTWAQAPKPTHGIKKVALTLLVLVSLVGASMYVYATYFIKSDDVQPAEDRDTLLKYDATDLGISFSYPTTYFVTVRSVSPNEEIIATTPIRNVILVEDTEVNRAILDGTYTEAIEGPTAITLDVYLNPQGLAVNDWVKGNPDWALGKIKNTDATYGGRSAAVFNWDGLYPGKSVVVTKDDITYVLSVTWITPEDQILKDFDTVLNAVVFNE